MLGNAKWAVAVVALMAVAGCKSGHDECLEKGGVCVQTAGGTCRTSTPLCCEGEQPLCREGFTWTGTAFDAGGCETAAPNLGCD